MSTNYTFEPEAVEALATAFHKSWSFISNDPHFAKKDPKVLQQRLAECLMQLAAKGEQDPLRLANGAIGRMRHEQGGSVNGKNLTPGTCVACLPEREFHQRIRRSEM